MRKLAWIFGWACAFCGLTATACSNDKSTGHSPDHDDAGVTGGKGGEGGSGGSAGGSGGSPDGGVEPDGSAPETGGNPGTGGTRPTAGKPVKVNVSGVVRSMGSDGASPFSGAAVRAGVDRNGNGTLDDAEAATAESDDTGAFTVAANADTVLPLVVTFTSPHFAPAFRTVPVHDASDVTVDGMLTELTSLDCDKGRCTDDKNTISITGLPDDLNVEARTFDSVNEAYMFPGAFADDGGNLLVSGVFSYVSLTDADDKPVSKLKSPATLKMKVGRSTWHLFTDVDTKKSGIQVPLYSFDEASGQWVADGQGELVDGTGTAIAEDQLGKIRDGSFLGAVTVRAEVKHFSYWNCDWPIETHGCVTFTAKTADGKVAVGATADLAGTTFDGTTYATVPESGKACVDVMRSEKPTEDIDQDGTLGEKHRLAVHVRYGDKIYDAGIHDVGTASATCGDDACTDLGELKLDESTALTPVICNIQGFVKDIHGVGVADQSLFASDDSIDSDMQVTICNGFQDCDIFVQSGKDGAFTYRTPLWTGLTLSSLNVVEKDNLQELRTAKLRFTRCPEQPVELVLDDGYDVETLKPSFADGKLSWDPPRPVQQVRVDGSGEILWWFAFTEQGQIAPPLDWGVTPAGATQVWPGSGKPTATPVSGDAVYLTGEGVNADGFPVYYSATFESLP